MKIIKSSPTNPQILNTYGGLLKVASLLIMFCICISSLTEMGVSYSFFDSKFSFMGYFGIFLTMSFTIAFVMLLEGGGKLSLSYSIDFFLYKRWKDKGLELILGIIVILTTLILYYTSVNISLNGSPTVVKSFEEAPELQNTKNIDSTLTIDKMELQKTFSNDSLLIAQGFNNTITNLKNEYKGKVEKEKIRITNYKRKEERTGNSYTTSINNLKGKIASLEAEEAQRIGKQESSKLGELRELVNERKNDLKNVAASHKSEKGKIENKNNTAINDFESEIKNSSEGLGSLILICLPILFLSVLVQRIIYKKSGIIVSYQFDDYYFRDSVFNTWLNYAKEGINEKAHSKIHEWHSKINDVQLNDRPIIIFDRAENTQYIKTQKEEAEEVELIALNSNVNYDRDKYKLLSEYVEASSAHDDKIIKVSNLEQKALELMKKAKEQREAGNEAEAKKFELKAKHVIKSFFESEFTPDYSKKIGRKFRSKLEGYLEGINSNPFDEWLPTKRRKIGFKLAGDENGKNYGGTDSQPESHTHNNYHFHGDKYTVPHTQDNGKTIHVSMKDILGKINLYSGRVSESYNKVEKYRKANKHLEVKRQQKALQNREQNLNYWNDKKKQLLNQVSK